MAWTGLGFAGLSGMLVGLLNYIPYVGSVLGVAVPVLLSRDGKLEEGEAAK